MNRGHGATRRKNIRPRPPARGFDSSFVLDGFTTAGSHVESGARSFGAYAEAMIADLGDAVRPYLKFFYNGIRDFPGFDLAKEMDPPGLVEIEAAKWATPPEARGQRTLSFANETDVAGLADAAPCVSGAMSPEVSGVPSPGSTVVASPGSSGANSPGSSGATSPGVTGATLPGSTGQRPLSTGDAVVFKTRAGDTIHGHLLQRQRGRRFAQVIDTEKRLWKVSEGVLQLSGKPPLSTILTPHDVMRAGWSVGDQVAFSCPDGPVRGEVVKLNPKRARVRCEGRLWNVPYGLLQRVGGEDAHGGAARLNEVAGIARRLMDEHGLTDWKLAFMESRRGLGHCDFRERVIRLGRSHALAGKDESIRDTVLHEIAHALAGPGAAHGPAWRAVAGRLGATPRSRSCEQE